MIYIENIQGYYLNIDWNDIDNIENIDIESNDINILVESNK